MSWLRDIRGIPKVVLRASDTWTDLAEKYYRPSQGDGSFEMAADGLARFNIRGANRNTKIEQGTEIELPYRLSVAKTNPSESSKVAVDLKSRLISVADLFIFKRCVYFAIPSERYLIRRQRPDGQILAPKSCSRQIKGKWIYVLTNDKVVAIVHAARSGKDGWKVERSHYDNHGPCPNGRILLKEGLEYDFFLSPVALPESVIAELEVRMRDKRNLFFDVPTHKVEQSDIRPKMTDPFLWTAQLTDTLVHPCRQAYDTWCTGEVNAAKLFIAGMLKSWIEPPVTERTGHSSGGDRAHPANESSKEDKDPYEVQELLQPGQPDKWLEFHEKMTNRLRHRLDVATASLARVAESQNHIIIELAAKAPPHEQAELLLGQWAIILNGCQKTASGNKFLARLLQDERKDRFPVQYILNDEPPDNSKAFAATRYAYLLSLSIIKDLGPTLMIRRMGASGVQELEKLKTYIERAYKAYQKIEPTLSALPKHIVDINQDAIRFYQSLEHMHKAIQSGEVPGGGSVDKRHWKKVFSIANVDADALHKAEERIASASPWKHKANSLAQAYEANLKGGGLVLVGALGVFEILNFTYAWSGHRDAEEKNLVTRASVLGATADLTVAAADVYVMLTKHVFGPVATRSVAALGLVSGVCDAIGFAGQAVNSAQEENYAVTVGSTLATVGASGSAVGATLAFLSTVSGPSLTAVVGAKAAGLTATVSLTGVGMVIAIIGAALAVVGSIIIEIFGRNDYQIFAYRSFLGKGFVKLLKEDKQKEYDWTDVRLPNNKAKDEARALRGLLGQFSVKTDWIDGCHLVTVRHGVVMPGDTFEVISKQTRWHTERRLFRDKRIKIEERVFHIRVDPVTQSFTAGSASGDPSIKLTYAQRTFTVKVTLLTTTWPYDHPHTDNDPRDTSEVEAWVRLVGNDGLFVPRKKTKSEPARYVYAPYHRYDREQRPSVNKEHWSPLPSPLRAKADGI